MFLSLILSLRAMIEPPSAVTAAEGTMPKTALVRERSRLVFAADGAASFLGILPAADLSLFAGGTFPGLRPRRSTHWTALGVRAEGTVGFVMLDTELSYFLRGVRAHLAVVGAAGKRGRLAYSAGVGPVFGFLQKTARQHPPQPYGLDLEGRVGYIFGHRSRTRARGVVGGMLRFTAQFDRVALYVPMYGVFLGLIIVPR